MNMIVHLYKCLSEETEIEKHYQYLIDKAKDANNGEIASMLENIVKQRKNYMKDITEIIQECIQVEHKTNVELQDFAKSINDIMIKTFL